MAIVFVLILLWTTDRLHLTWLLKYLLKDVSNYGPGTKTGGGGPSLWGGWS